MKLSKFLVVLPLSLSIAFMATFSATAAPKVADKIAAIVNNNVILESEVNSMLSNITASTDPNNLPDNKTLRKQVIDRLIIENLMLQLADKAKITINKDDVAAAVMKIASENNMDLSQLREKVTSMGISYPTYLDRIKKDMLIEQVRLNAIRQRINISDKEVENLVTGLSRERANNTEVDLSHILIAIPDKASKAQISRANNQAKDIIDRLQKGESFAKLATTYSNDDYALKGGAMGWHRLDELPTIFEGPLTQAAKGAIVGPIRSGVGFHILKINDTRSQKEIPVIAEEVNARHILIKTNVLMTDEKAKQKIEDIRKSIINKTTTFDAAAKAYSEDPGSAEKGGDLGWSTPNRYDDNFKNGLLKLKKGEISQPIKSAFGWHLIQLMGKRRVDKTNLALKEQAYRLIFNKKMAEESPIWIQELKSDAYIKIIGDDSPDSKNNE